MNSARAPTLLDLFDAKVVARAMPACARAVERARYRARRFVFSDEVTASIARLVRDYPDVLLSNYQFALPPYECCYLEYNIELFQSELGGPTTADIFGGEADINVGYVIDGHQVTPISGDYDDIASGTPEFFEDGGRNTFRWTSVTSGLSFTYVEHKPLPGFHLVMPTNPFAGREDVSEYLRSGKASDDIFLAHILGSTFSDERASLTPEIASDLTQRVRVYLDRNADRLSNEDAERILQGCTGEVRDLMALLLWLAQPSVSHLVEMPSSRGWHHGRSIAYAAHHVVRLSKEATSIRYLLRAIAPRRPPRRHEVAAFWRNYDKTECEHDWPILPDEDGHWHCRKCPQWRTRVRQHERGDAAVGFVTKEYLA